MYTDKWNIVHVTYELFAEGQGEAEDEKDRRVIRKSMRACKSGNCSLCILNDFTTTEPCDEILERIYNEKVKGAE
jgi:hypothetical protein